MKIDRRNPRHWLLLVAFLVQALIGLLIRLLRPSEPEPVVVLYGHRLNGNLRALHDGLVTRGEPMAPVFLTMDRGYRKQLRSRGVDARWACAWEGARVLARASAVVSDHGLHAMELLLRPYRWLRMRFYDVWHGIPFKGFNTEDFRLQHQYDEVWVASDFMRDLYVRKFGFDPRRVVATGYARTDPLLLRHQDRTAIRAQLGLPLDGAILLFAPTWAQDARGRSIYPFDTPESVFVQALSKLADRCRATVLLRPHLNTAGGGRLDYPHVVMMPAARFPDTEAILLASDVLVCDWSSIAFDFLLLDRPTFFLDVEAPFRKGFSLGPEFRFGAVVPNLQLLVDSLEQVLRSQERYWSRYGPRHAAIKKVIYGERADGNATDRCVGRLVEPTCSV